MGRTACTEPQCLYKGTFYLLPITICSAVTRCYVREYYCWSILTIHTKFYFKIPDLGNDYVTLNVHGSMHRKCIPVYIQQDATLHSLFISGNCSTYFGWYLHPSSGAHTTVSTASGTCQTVTATSHYSSISSTTAAGSSNGLTSTRCCRYSCVCSWWWVEVPSATCRAVSRYKLTV